MSKLEDMIAELCPNGVEYVALKHYRLKSVGLRAKALFVATESRCSV